MDLAVCVTCGGENGTNGSYLAVFSKDVDFVRHLHVGGSPPAPILPS